LVIVCWRYGITSEKEQNLFRARLANARKFLQRFLGFAQRLFENGAKISLKLLKRNRGNLAELSNALLGKNSQAGDGKQQLIRRGENLLRFCSHLLLEHPKSLLPSLIINQIRHIFPEDHFKRVGQLRWFRSPVKFFEHGDDFLKRGLACHGFTVWF
jgi:hypothetical protein